MTERDILNQARNNPEVKVSLTLDLELRSLKASITETNFVSNILFFFIRSIYFSRWISTAKVSRGNPEIPNRHKKCHYSLK